MVFQIAAEDEFRENFDLTNIDSAGLKGLEITLPGVHSDIGGSYRNDDGPEVRTHYEASYTKRIGENNTFYHNKAKKIKEMLVYEGWYNNDQLVISEEITGENSYKLKLTGTRQLLNTYDKISLARMIAITKQFDVKFIDSRVEKLTKINDPFIKKIESQLMVYIKQCSDLRNDYINNAHNSDESLAVYTQKYLENIKRLNHINDVDLNDLKELRGKYLHWSVNNDKIGLEARTNIIGYAGDLKEQKLRKREIQNG